jgi:F1F0 ATPase subunit 2
MNEAFYMILAFIAGLLLGALFFGGLWLTVRKTLTAKAPALWLIIGFFIRISITLIGFYFVSRDSWQRLLICLLGFIIARLIMMQWTKKIEQKKEVLNIKNDHEA